MYLFQLVNNDVFIRPTQSSQLPALFDSSGAPRYLLSTSGAERLGYPLNVGKTSLRRESKAKSTSDLISKVLISSMMQ